MDRLCHLIRAFMKRKLSMKIRVVFFTQIRFSKSESIYVEHLTAHMTKKNSIVKCNNFLLIFLYILSHHNKAVNIHSFVGSLL